VRIRPLIYSPFMLDTNLSIHLVGPVMEAFGYQRIIFGSSPCPTSSGSSIASDWYELARESLAELGVEQETIDAVFYGNAKKVYGSA
jgi:predicted TIM-barrel fold metal-dependent hydrolase